MADSHYEIRVLIGPCDVSDALDAMEAVSDVCYAAESPPARLGASVSMVEVDPKSWKVER